jgi:hypothetical protein
VMTRLPLAVWRLIRLSRFVLIARNLINRMI